MLDAKEQDRKTSAGVFNALFSRLGLLAIVPGLLLVIVVGIWFYNKKAPNLAPENVVHYLRFDLQSATMQGDTAIITFTVESEIDQEQELILKAVLYDKYGGGSFKETDVTGNRPAYKRQTGNFLAPPPPPPAPARPLPKSFNEKITQDQKDRHSDFSEKISENLRFSQKVARKTPATVQITFKGLPTKNGKPVLKRGALELETLIFPFEPGLSTDSTQVVDQYPSEIPRTILFEDIIFK